MVPYTLPVLFTDLLVTHRKSLVNRFMPSFRHDGSNKARVSARHYAENYVPEWRDAILQISAGSLLTVRRIMRILVAEFCEPWRQGR